MEVLEARKETKKDFKKWALIEEISWRQKSRKVWLREGDKNTGFFHKMTNSHRRRNCFSKIKLNGIWLTEEQEIKEVWSMHFRIFCQIRVTSVQV